VSTFEMQSGRCSGLDPASLPIPSRALLDALGPYESLALQTFDRGNFHSVSLHHVRRVYLRSIAIWTRYWIDTNPTLWSFMERRTKDMTSFYTASAASEASQP